MVIDTRRKTIAENIANGMSRDRAGVLADLAVKSEVISALAQYDVNPMNVLDASINDALQSVGRNKTLTIKGIEQSQKNISDEGFMSYWPIKLLEMVSAGAGREGSSMQIFAKMLYGFALVPARVFHNVAWFSPYGFIRLGIDKYKKNKGEDSPYAMSLQTEAQYKQRLTDAIAGSVAMLGLAPVEDDDGNAASGLKVEKNPSISVHPEGPDWYKTEGAGMSAAKAKAEGLGEKVNQWLGDLETIPTLAALRGWADENGDTIRTMPKGWRIEVREAFDRRGRELGAM